MHNYQLKQSLQNQKVFLLPTFPVKHSNNSNDKSSSKKANNGVALCINCVKLNARGKTIPEYVMKNHTAANKKGSFGSSSKSS
jgi:hypothetical protein